MMRFTGDGGRRPRILLGDRQPIVLEAIAALIDTRGFEVTARVQNGHDAASAIAAGEIDIAVLDIDLAAPGPLALIDERRARGQRLPIIVTVPDAEHASLAAIIESCADGLVLKSEGANCLFHALGTVTSGGQWFDRFAMARALDRVAASSGAALLTRRERDVARLVATGQRNRNIAGVLGISEGTVKMHLHNVYAKLGLESRTQLAMDERLRLLG